jgi:hemerythrin superfamily protein
MNAIELLKQQHREVEELFNNIESADDPKQQVKLFRELAGKLVGHDGIERQIFYPACEEGLGMTEDLGQALVEHGVVEFSLYEADQAAGKPDFEFKVKVLKELLQHHIEEEEGEFFPKVQQALGDEKLELLGEELDEAFEDLLEKDYHQPLFENLRQVLVGALKPVVEDTGDEGDGQAENKPRPRKASGTRKGSGTRKSA